MPTYEVFERFFDAQGHEVLKRSFEVWGDSKPAAIAQANRLVEKRYRGLRLEREVTEAKREVPHANNA